MILFSVLASLALRLVAVTSAQVETPTAPALEAPGPSPDPVASPAFVPPAQAPAAPTPVSSVPSTVIPPSYHSDDDDLLSIDRISVLPFTDNMQGIYAKPLEAHFIQGVEHQHRWDFVPATGAGSIEIGEEYEADPAKVIAAAHDLPVDAIFTARITKTPSGITVRLNLFLTKDGKLLAQAELKNHPRFDITDLKDQVTRLSTEIMTRLPYSGRVLSREGLRVTINLGTQDGIRKDQVLEVMQILKVQRHPKFNFLIRTEKMVYGQVRVQKADETLSFATIVMEKESGAVQKGAKLASLETVTYAAPDDPNRPKPNKIAFGDFANEWQPTQPPSIGRVAAHLGLGRFTDATSVNGVGGLQASDDGSPSVSIEGELWITPEWTANARIRQGLVSLKNVRDDSTPRNLSASLSTYDLNFGYTLRFGTSAAAPSVEPYIGYFLARFYIDNSSPLTYTTTRYQGAKLGVRGTSPILDGEYGVGGDFALGLGPGLDEDPVTSGGKASNSVIQFGISGYRKFGEHFHATVGLDFDFYSSTFTGDGGRGAQSATSLSQRYTSASVGAAYLF